MLHQESDRIGLGNSHRYLGSLIRVIGGLLLLVTPALAQQQIPSTPGSGSGGSVQITDGVDNALVSGSGSLQVTCDNCGGSTFADNSTFTFGTTNILNVGYVFDDVAPNAVTENRAATPRMSSNRVPYAQLRDAAGNERGANVNASNELLVNATQSGSWTVTANAGSGTFTVGAVNLDVRDLVFATDKVDVSGSSVEVKGQGSLVPIFCTSTAFLNMTTATTTQIVALSGGTHIYVCSYSFHVGGATNLRLVSGTGSNCDTSQANASVNYHFATPDVGINRVAGGGSIVSRTVDAGDALCVTSSLAVDADVEVSYAQF